jgi:hypothetical protein
MFYLKLNGRVLKHCHDRVKNRLVPYDCGPAFGVFDIADTADIIMPLTS